MHASIKQKRMRGFTLVEILIVIAILAVLAVVTFVVINPVERLNAAKDQTRREDVNSILQAIVLYSVDNAGSMSTYNSGTALPVVTTANIMTAGIVASSLDVATVPSLTKIPKDPDGVDYRVGVSSSGTPIVGITLSNNTVFVKTQ